MTEKEESSYNLQSLIADHMEAGFLENIIDMFLHDPGLYGLIGGLIQDERVRVRIGTTALMEELRVKDGGKVSRAVSGLLPLLDHPDAVVRGDASNLLGIAGDKDIIPSLKKALTDENSDVKVIAREAIDEITRRSR